MNKSAALASFRLRDGEAELKGNEAKNAINARPVPAGASGFQDGDVIVAIGSVSDLKIINGKFNGRDYQRAMFPVAVNNEDNWKVVNLDALFRNHEKAVEAFSQIRDLEIGKDYIDPNSINSRADLIEKIEGATIRTVDVEFDAVEATETQPAQEAYTRSYSAIVPKAGAPASGGKSGGKKNK